MHDPLDAIRRLYGEPGEGLPAEGAEPKAMAEMKAALDGLPSRGPDPSVIDAVVAAAAEAARPAALAPIRAAYGDEAVALDAEGEAEARVLGSLKAALDALPPQRPDASLVESVLEAAGEAARPAALAPVRAVYDEAAEPLASPAAEAEATALAEVKAGLDQLPPRRPDAAVIDAVVAAATQPVKRPVAAVAGRAADRPARRGGGETRRRVATVLGAVFAVVLVFGAGLWLNQEAPTIPEVTVSEQSESGDQVAEAAPQADGQEEATPEADAAPAADVPAAPPADDAMLASATPPPSAPARTQATARRAEPGIAADAVAADAAETLTLQAAAPTGGADRGDLSLAEAMALDDDDEFRLMYLRLREMQAAQSGLGWDAPPVSLGATPDSVPAAPAAGWMQVRVQR